MSSAAEIHAEGFNGAVTGMTIPDLLQIKGVNRFTGRISIEHGRDIGQIFFRDGDIIHAELNGLEGRGAFDRIMRWVGGTFRTEPKITTTRQTITDGLQFLLLDALRLRDEAMAEPGGAEEMPEKQEQKGGTMTDRLSTVSGLMDAAITSRQGDIIQGVGENAETIAAQGMYLVMTSEKIGEGMGLGSFKGAVVQGGRSHIIVLEGPRNYLFAGVDGSAKSSSVETEIRRALSGPR